MPFSRMDPSCTIGFYASGQQELELLCTNVNEVCLVIYLIPNLAFCFGSMSNIWQHFTPHSHPNKKFADLILSSLKSYDVWVLHFCRWSPHQQRDTPCLYFQRGKVGRTRSTAAPPCTGSPISRGAAIWRESAPAAAWTSLFCCDRKAAHQPFNVKFALLRTETAIFTTESAELIRHFVWMLYFKTAFCTFENVF